MHHGNVNIDVISKVGILDYVQFALIRDFIGLKYWPLKLDVLIENIFVYMTKQEEAEKSI